VRNIKVSPDHRHLAFASDMGRGNERFVGVIKGLEGTKKHLESELLPGVGTLEWMEDGRRLLYTVVEPSTGRPYKVRKQGNAARFLSSFAVLV
jgi:protease II